MRLSTATSLFFSTLCATTLAAPTRTQCRCKVIADTPAQQQLPQQPIYTPSAEHWAPSDPTPSATPPDICSSLGPELENMAHSHPDVYNTYLGSSSSSSSSNSNSNSRSPRTPIPTTVLLNEPRPTTRPQQRIVCYSEQETYPGYQSSFLSLWMLHVVLAVVVIACVVEGVYLALQLLRKNDKTQQTHAADEKGGLRLPGGERLLLAIPTKDEYMDSIFSPGVEKKKRAYESTRYFVKESPSGRREFIAYEDEDDDEANRPVM